MMTDRRLRCIDPERADAGLIDDFRGAEDLSRLGTPWRLITDQVMGGVSQGQLVRAPHDGRSALGLTGELSLENNGGFVQANLALAPAGLFDAGAYSGVRLLVQGDDQTYGLHLKSADTDLPWQSYRAGFSAPPAWQELRFPFTAFVPYRVAVPLARSRLLRLGVVAIGRVTRFELWIAEIGFY